MFQDGQLFNHLSVEGNVAYGLYREPKAVRRARVAELLAVVGLSGYGKRRVSELSGGQAQRVALARSLAPRPRLLLLDEPFVGLDPVAGHVLKTQLRELCSAGGAVLFSTHILEVAQALCDDIAIISRGRLVVAGPTATVVGDSSLERVFLELQDAAGAPPPRGREG